MRRLFALVGGVGLVAAALVGVAVAPRLAPSPTLPTPDELLALPTRREREARLRQAVGPGATRAEVDRYFDLKRAVRHLACADQETLRAVLVGILSDDEGTRARANDRVRAEGQRCLDVDGDLTGDSARRG